MTRIDEVLERPEIRARPPVLIDIGASGRIHAGWKRLARHSICLAFDADDRDFGKAAEREHPYRTLHLHNNIVSDSGSSEVDFYLTKSPHCSSSLHPDNAKLSSWIFADLFDVERKVKLRARTLPDFLKEHDLSYVDWLKVDSQGTDLRLFASLGDEIIRRMLSVSFEPGLIDAYVGEDKLHAILARMDQLPFWIHDLDVRGTQRLSRSLWEGRVRPLTHGAPPIGLKTSPGWVEISYLNTLEQGDRFDRRDFLLAWVLASLHEQHGFAFEVALAGEQRFGDRLFGELADESLARLTSVADRVLPRAAKRMLNLVRDTGNRLFRR
jgi:FkbM family methyltransferase